MGNPCKTSMAFNVLIIDSISVLISLLEKCKKTHEKFYYFNVLKHLIHKKEFKQLKSECKYKLIKSNCSHVLILYSLKIFF